MDNPVNLEPKKIPRDDEEDEYRSPKELGPLRGCDIRGRPLDPDHPWNRVD